jgi:hypothetical protein
MYIGELNLWGGRSQVVIYLTNWGTVTGIRLSYFMVELRMTLCCQPIEILYNGVYSAAIHGMGGLNKSDSS